MKVNEILYLLNKDLKSSILKNPQSSKYIILAYNNVYKKIKNEFNTPVQINDIKKLDISDHMKNKLIFLLNQPINKNDLKQIITNQLIDDLMNIPGIGKSKANYLIKLGITKISDLTKKKYLDQLNDDTKMILKYKPDRKVLHNDITKIKNKLTNYPNTIIVGSYRRKKAFSRDIDIMLVSDDSINKYIDYLKTVFKEVHIYSHGNNKVSLIILIKKINEKKIYYKIDIFRSLVKYQYAMLLYSTGSKEFNIRMRLIASKMGYLLNQHGLYNKKNMSYIKVSSEHDFFKKLNMEYVNPEDR
jgi:DNA polymerase/3'-5' exonuclease PolX